MVTVLLEGVEYLTLTKILYTQSFHLIILELKFPDEMAAHFVSHLPTTNVSST